MSEVPFWCVGLLQWQFDRNLSSIHMWVYQSFRKLCLEVSIPNDCRNSENCVLSLSVMTVAHPAVGVAEIWFCSLLKDWKWMLMSKQAGIWVNSGLILNVLCVCVRARENKCMCVCVCFFGHINYSLWSLKVLINLCIVRGGVINNSTN